MFSVWKSSLLAKHVSADHLRDSTIGSFLADTAPALKFLCLKSICRSYINLMLKCFSWSLNEQDSVLHIYIYVNTEMGSNLPHQCLTISFILSWDPNSRRRLQNKTTLVFFNLSKRSFWRDISGLKFIDNLFFLFKWSFW